MSAIERADLQRLQRHVAQLGEYFETVQIFVTRHSPEDEGTINCCWGSGNWFARYGQVRSWLVKEEDSLRAMESEEGMNAPIEILLVEDNLGDIRLTQEVFKDCRVLNHLSVARDGDEALERLRDPSVPRPNLILLDLNLPKKDGREVLAEIKADPDLRRIPVVILTTSNAEQDILRCYDLHGNCYLTKPVQLTEFMAVMRTIEDFWLMIVKFPPPPRSS